ncbi:phosphoribosylglycinamide formyltransferase [Nanoarchaeota archaeon]
MIKIGVLASTNATDMQAIIDAIEDGSLDAEISLLIVNKENCGAVEKAKKYNIPYLYINSKDKSREEFDKEANKALNEHGVQIIFLIGYMRIVTPYLVNEWRNKILNIHPSLLPKYAGGMDLDVHQEVLNGGEKVTGATLHYVEEEVDAGPILFQEEVPIEAGETSDSLKEKVQKVEQGIIIKAIRYYSEGKIDIGDTKVKE